MNLEHVDISLSDETDGLEDEKLRRLTQPVINAILNHYVALKLEEGASPEEIIRQLRSNEADLSAVELQFSLTIASSFSDPIKEAISNENHEVASVLCGTQIEHIMNMFLTDVLENKFPFSDTEISQILNTISLPAKLTWFLIMATGLELDEKLCKKLLRIVNLRNKIAHFKSLSSSKKLFSEEDIDLLSNFPILIPELEQELSSIWIEVFPLYEDANKILEENFDISSDYFSRRMRI